MCAEGWVSCAARRALRVRAAASPSSSLASRVLVCFCGTASFSSSSSLPLFWGASSTLTSLGDGSRRPSSNRRIAAAIKASDDALSNNTNRSAAADVAKVAARLFFLFFPDNPN